LRFVFQLFSFTVLGFQLAQLLGLNDVSEWRPILGVSSRCRTNFCTCFQREHKKLGIESKQWNMKQKNKTKQCCGNIHLKKQQDYTLWHGLIASRQLYACRSTSYHFVKQKTEREGKPVEPIWFQVPKPMFLHGFYPTFLEAIHARKVSAHHNTGNQSRLLLSHGQSIFT